MTGRPPIYSDDLAAQVCSRLAAGESLRAICRDEGMPDRSTVMLWVTNDTGGFSGRYARARDEQLANLADEVLEIADDGSRDYKQDAEGRDVPDHDHIQRSKLRVDTRKWLLSKLMPKVYGDRLDVNATVSRAAEDMTDAQLAAIASGSRAGATAPAEDEG